MTEGAARTDTSAGDGRRTCGTPSLVRWGAAPSTAPIAVLGLHGRGQGPEFVEDLARRIAVDGLHWAAPAAPGGTWYPHSFLEPVERNQPGLDAAVGTVDRALQVLEDDGFTPDRVVLLGFSQGACLLTHVLLTRPRRFAGAAILTGGYQGSTPPAALLPGTFRGIRIVMSLGTEDPFVPFTRAAATRDVLRAAGATVEWLPFVGAEHVVVDGAVQAIRALVSDRIG